MSVGQTYGVHMKTEAGRQSRVN